MTKRIAAPSAARSLAPSAERIRGTQFSTHHLTSVHHRRRRRRDELPPPSDGRREAGRGNANMTSAKF